ncbi:16S rRNA (guanine(966)-N(2))-methyltransferase RsmD [Candidatus Saccharibacteria bacterium]|nr:16S rRNA (guanine(966)-N(2))-methyltransferase RsmD [Candidatus Saccharibacteria bacterium]
MNVRVIAGRFGGRIIDAPSRRSTHAMSSRIRNALFNSLAGQIKDVRVLDAFAGSGAVGIEALSRGAASCIFIERNHVAARIIQKNLNLIGAEVTGKVISTTVNNWLSTNDERLFDIIFADPPYHDTQLNTVLKLLSLLEDDGKLIVSLPLDQEVPAVQGVQVIDERIYGNAKLVTISKR